MIRRDGGVLARAHAPVQDQAATDQAATGKSIPELADPELAGPGLADMDHAVLARWSRTDLPGRRAAAAAGRPGWTCYESPPLDGSLPGVHHIAGRTIADLYLRFMTMRGFHATRRTSLSCHGLPVEVAVESELGLSGLAGIEDYGPARFAERCRESVLRHAAAFVTLDARLGCWPAGPVARTMDTGYIEAAWRSFRDVFDAGLVVRDDRIVPYCPRCQTPLSACELGQPGVHRPEEGSDLIVRFRLVSVADGAHPRLRGADLLVNVSAPWTLAANAAIAVHPHESYAIARRAGHDERVVVAECRVPQVLGESWHVAARVTGATLAGARYAAPLEMPAATAGQEASVPRDLARDLPRDQRAEREVVASYLVNIRGGTGLQHLAPAFAAQDREAAAAHGLPAPDPLGPDGRFAAGTPVVGGLLYTEADRLLAGLLADRGLVFSARSGERTRPHCWRCGAALLLRAWPAWHIRVGAAGSRLAAASEQVRWQPPAGQDERLHGWLRGEADWTVSRSRYWGTPLPIWECAHGHRTCAGSLAELGELAGRDLAGLDPHRPHIDAVTIRCRQCGSEARRVPDVLDMWFDAGVLPRVPHPARTPEPAAADLAVETAESGGAWCYDMVATGALTSGRAPFQAALRTGQVQDAAGRPMSRQSGNLAEPLPLIERHGADAVRWFFTLAAPPGKPRRVTDTALAEVADGVLARYRDAARQFTRCARAAAERGFSWHLPAAALAPDDRPLPDRWLRNELARLVSDVTAALDALEPSVAGERIAAFTDLLARWYLPRSAARLWLRPGTAGPGTAGPGTAGPGTADGHSALATLRECMEVLTRVLAPAAPFLADYVWALLRPWLPDAPDSVHLTGWPPATRDYDEHLADGLSLARRLGGLGANARLAAGLTASQPLARGLAEFRPAHHGTGPDAELRAELAHALNVRSLDVFWVDAGQGQPAGRAAGESAGESAGQSASQSAGQSGAARLDGDAGRSTAAWGADWPADWAVAAQDGELVALDVAISAELVSEGLAREVIAVVGAVRGAGGDSARGAGGDSEPRGWAPIALWWRTERADVAQALHEHAELIAAELHLGSCRAAQLSALPTPGAAKHADEALDLTFWLSPPA